MHEVNVKEKWWKPPPSKYIHRKRYYFMKHIDMLHRKPLLCVIFYSFHTLVRIEEILGEFHKMDLKHKIINVGSNLKCKKTANISSVVKRENVSHSQPIYDSLRFTK